MSEENSHVENGHKQLKILGPDQQDHPVKGREGFDQELVQDHPAYYG